MPASRKLGRDDAARLAGNASRVIVAKGKSVVAFDGGAGASNACIDAMLGPTGNLRAPTLVAGRTVLVGFDDGAWRSALG